MRTKDFSAQKYTNVILHDCELSKRVSSVYYLNACDTPASCLLGSLFAPIFYVVVFQRKQSSLTRSFVGFLIVNRAEKKSSCDR